MGSAALRFSSRLLAAGAALILLGAGDTHAAVLYDNLSAVTAGLDPIVTIGPLADSFSTGASGFSLADVKVLLQGSGGKGRTTVSLLSDNATSPGSLLTTIGTIAGGSLSTSVPTVVDLRLAAAYGLSAMTRYWIELSSSDSTTGWWWSLDQTPPGVSGEFFFNTSRGVQANSNGPYQMCVADAGGGCSTPIISVAEPANFSILGLSLLALGLVRRVRI